MYNQKLEGATGIEPVTVCFRDTRSTVELRRNTYKSVTKGSNGFNRHHPEWDGREMSMPPSVVVAALKTTFEVPPVVKKKGDGTPVVLNTSDSL